MTPYELMCDGKTHRWNGNIFLHNKIMYYLSDSEVEACVAQVIVDMAKLEKLKSRGR